MAYHLHKGIDPSPSPLAVPTTFQRILVVYALRSEGQGTNSTGVLVTASAPTDCPMATPCKPWKIAYESSKGAASTGLYLGPVLNASSQSSQTVELHSTSSVGMDVAADFQLDQNGVASVTVPNAAGSGFELLLAGLPGIVPFSASGTGITVAPPAATSGTPTLMTITGPADTGLLDTQANDVLWALNRTVTFTGSATVGGANFSPQAAVLMKPPTYAFGTGAAQTIDTASTITIQGPPLGGTNATLTNSYGLHIPSSAVTNVINSFGLRADAPTGATLNGAAYFNGNVGVLDSAPANPLSIESGKFTVNTTGRIANYSGVSTVFGGVAASVGVNATGVVASSTTGVTALASAVNTAYRINYYLLQYNAGVGCTSNASVSATIAWNDAGNLSPSRVFSIPALSMGNTNPATAYASGSIPVTPAASTAITFSTSYTPPGGCTLTNRPYYDMVVWVEAM